MSVRSKHERGARQADRFSYRTVRWHSGGRPEVFLPRVVFLPKPLAGDERLSARASQSAPQVLNNDLVDGSDVTELLDCAGEVALVCTLVVDDCLVFLGLHFYRFHAGNGFERFLDVRSIRGAR